MLLDMQELTGEAPQALRDRPKLLPHLSFYKQLFTELSSSRIYSQHGQPMPIPISEISAYFALFEIKELSEKQVIFRALRALDKAYVDVSTEKLKQQMAASDKQP